MSEAIMTPRIVLLMTSFGIALAVDPLDAQTCRGTAPFTDGNFKLGATIGGVPAVKHVYVDHGSSLGLEAGLGLAGGWFLGVGASAVFLSSPVRFVQKGLAAHQTDDATATVVSATVGMAIPITASGRAELCPLIGYTRQSGPEMWSGCSNGACMGSVDGTVTAFALGGTAGIMLGSGATRINPIGGASFVTSSLKVQGAGPGQSVRESYLGLAGGVGIILGRVSIRPAITFPVGLDDADSKFSLDLIVSIGAQSGA